MLGAVGKSKASSTMLLVSMFRVADRDRASRNPFVRAKVPLSAGHTAGCLMRSPGRGLAFFCGGDVCMWPMGLASLWSLFLSLSLSLCLYAAQGVGGLTFAFALVLVSSTCRWARLATHRHEEPHFVCIPCSRAHFCRGPTACGSSPKTWAVSKGSHMQQDMDMS